MILPPYVGHEGIKGTVCILFKLHLIFSHMNGPIVSDYHNGLETKENQNLAETKKKKQPTKCEA